MNKAQEILAKIKAAFETVEQVPPVTVVEIVAATHKLLDGTEISTDKLEVGGMVMVSGAAAIAGEYTLEDGTVLGVDATGLITSVTPKVEQAAAPAAPEPAPVAPQVAPVIPPSFLAQVEKLEADNKNFTTQIEKLNSIVAQMFALVTEMSGETPEVAPPAKKKFSFSNVEGKNKSLTKFQAAAKQLSEELHQN